MLTSRKVKVKDSQCSISNVYYFFIDEECQHSRGENEVQISPMTDRFCLYLYCSVQENPVMSIFISVLSVSGWLLVCFRACMWKFCIPVLLFPSSDFCGFTMENDIETIIFGYTGMQRWARVQIQRWQCEKCVWVCMWVKVVLLDLLVSSWELHIIMLLFTAYTQ